MKILVVHEVNYLSKIIYEFQILPELFSILGHDVTVVDYDDTWDRDASREPPSLRTRVYSGVHRAYAEAAVTIRRPGMAPLPILSRMSAALTGAFEIRRILNKSKPDGILLYAVPTIGVQTLFLAGRVRVPVIFRSIDVTHELVPNRLLSPATHVLAGYVFRHANLNVALTPHLKSYIQSYGVPESRIRLLPSGVDTQMFCPGARNAQMLRQWNIEPDDRVILFMGTIYRFSGLDRVITDLHKLLARHPRTKLLIVGSGEDEQRLKQLAVERNVASNVVFGGLLPYSALPDLIRSSDVCINPFELNGITQNILPTKLFQYLACARPVVATELPGTLNFLGGEQQGIVYASLDKFVDQLSAMLANPGRMSLLGSYGPAAIQIYDWKRIAQTMLDWIREAA
ncbi:MAG: glycosyltransferase [Acidobacteria bacterium]|nr:glycosyltransferase [Acidobacteriota bacterium]